MEVCGDGEAGLVVANFLFFLWLLVVELVEDVELPLAESCARPAGAGGVTAWARGGWMLVLLTGISLGNAMWRSPMVLTKRRTPRAMACARAWR